MVVIRPCDANETAAAWRVAVETPDTPIALILTRQNVPTLDRERYASAEGLRRGTYILLDSPDEEPELILIATGSEVSLIVSAQEQLMKDGIRVRSVSMPSWELFEAQPQEYRNSVLPPSVRARLAVEAGSPQGWRRYVGDEGDVIGLDHFGASAPGKTVISEFGFTVENVITRALNLLEGKGKV